MNALEVHLKPRYFGSITTIIPPKEVIRKYVESLIGQIHDPDDPAIDIDKLAEGAYYHFNGGTSYLDVPDIYYEVVEEMVL